MVESIDILAVVTRPTFGSGLGPIGDHMNLKGLAHRRADMTIRIIELNSRATHFHLDSECLLIEQHGVAPVSLGTAALILYMPVSLDVEETDLSPPRQDDRWPTFTRWQWRAITEYLDDRLPRIGHCVNKPHAARRANNKLLQWEILSAAGFEIPPLAAATQWPLHGRLSGSDALVRKNLSESGWKAEGVFSPACMVRRGERPDALPAIWQRPVDAEFEIRCYVFGDETIFVRLERDPSTTDVRVTNGGRPRAGFVDTPHGWRDMMLGAARALDLDFAVIDALPHQGSLTILEVNANGVWWFLPHEVAQILEARFHHWLEGLVKTMRP